MDLPVLLGSLNAARQLGSALVEERDRQKAAAIQIDLSEKIVQAQTQISEVLATIISKDATIAALTERIRELEAQQSERARYELAKLGTLGDIFAYRLRAASELVERSNEPVHFLCQPCFDGGKKSVLTLNKHFAFCSLCKIKHQIAELPPPVVRRTSSPFSTRW